MPGLRDTIFPTAEVPLKDFQAAMLNGTPDCIKILSPDGRLLAMNRAGCRALGVREDSGFGMPWLALLPSSVRPAGRKALRKAAEGRTARFPGRSVGPDGTVYWDNLLTPIVDASGRTITILCVSRDVTETTKLERQLEASITREQLLSQELQHRIKNLFAIVGELISISEEEATKDRRGESATRILREKVKALSRASDAAFPITKLEKAGEQEFELRSLVSAVLRPYGTRSRTSGEEIYISHGSMTTVALFLHELATNSVKYGALSNDGGNIDVDWSAEETALTMTWRETGGPQISCSPRRQGFGNEMVDHIVNAVGGSVRRDWLQEGLIARMILPNLQSR